MYIIFDLDGTLADIRHRLHYIKDKPKDWNSFYKACVEDKPIRSMIILFRMLDNHKYNRIEIWTGRSSIVRKETEEWLLNYKLFYNELRMRDGNNYVQDYILKEAWLKKSKTIPDLVFEDRERVVEMWRSYGVQCCQVGDGNF